ncbi:MAG TPA: substrate-binding domain-containing protein [Pirellulaceae bacterium]|nr:substrate-binding domain-containing protein [Pirellulaceae bacterium]
MLVRVILYVASSVLVSALCLVGCGNPELPSSSVPGAGAAASGSDAATSKGTVGVSVLTFTNPFFRVIGNHIEDELRQAGYDTIVVAGEKDIAAQERQVNDFISKGCVAIVLCPCDSKAIGAVIKKANAAGVPVFTADIASLDPEAKVVSHIATDNSGGGKQAGEAMIEALGEGGGKVVILDYEAAESCILRVKGFREVIDAYNEGREAGKIEIVAELPGDGDTQRGDKAAQDALQAHPDLAGIFAINDPSAIGAWKALERAGKTDQVKIIGFDGQDFGKEAIRDGKIYADPIQHPDQIGRLTAQAILNYIDGEEVKDVQLIPTTLYRLADSLNDPELKKQ